MKSKAIITLLFVILATVFTASGCKSYNRTRTVFFWDRNVTQVKKPAKRRMRNRTKVVRSRAYNKANRLPGR